ncbi:MAG: L,D-transpeptidase family protein [Aestuariivirga sp.]
MGLVMQKARTSSFVAGLAILIFVPGDVFAESASAGLFEPLGKQEAPIKPSGVPTTVTEVVAGQNQMPILQSNSEKLLTEDAAKYRAIIAAGGFVKVPAFAFKKGDESPNVGILNQRLFQEGYLQVEGTQGQFANVFTSATKDALSRYQGNHGLFITGKLNSFTLAELNIPAEQRLATIEANIPRLATYEVGLGDRYIVVNVPAQQLEAVAGGRVVERHNTIVGRPARPTPVVMTGIETVKFNPYWFAPSSIVRKDIVPKLQHDLSYLKQLDIKIFKGDQNGPEVDPKTLDFKNLVAEDYLFRQEPGPENAMDTAKIEFRSPFGIYLHDTPEKQMFNYNNRFFSSGCIRIQNMSGLVNWVLNGQDGYNPDKIASMAKTLERLDVGLVAPLQLRVAYLTAWPSIGGTVSFRPDVYQMDGSGFIVGQPMAVGEMSPDGKRFVLKPLPSAPSVDDAEAGGSGFFGSKMGKISGSATTSAASMATTKATEQLASSSKSGLFDWPSYYKKKAANEKASADAAQNPKKKLLKKKSGTVVADAKAKDKKLAAKKSAMKKPDVCKTDGNAVDGCKPMADTVDKATDVPKPVDTTAAIEAPKPVEAAAPADVPPTPAN